MDKFVELLTGILTQLGIAATYLWPKAVLHTVVSAITEIIAFGLFGSFLLYGSRLLWRRADFRDKERYGDDEATAACRIFSWILFFLGPTLAIVGAGCNIATLVSPEYATVRDLIAIGAPRK